MISSLITATLVSAQEFQRLQDVADQAFPAYLPTRCAALNQAIMEYAGEERMGSELFRQSDEVRSNFIVIAVLVSQNIQGGTVAEWTEQVVYNVRIIANIYWDRFERNYAASGQAFGQDALVASDLEVCRGAAEELM